MTVCYRVTLESPLGPRPGLLRLEALDGEVTGTLSLLGFDNAVSGRRLDARRLLLTHGLRTAVSSLSCESILELDGAALIGTACTGNLEMSWRGELVQSLRR